jgi:hypothetical protein
MAIGKESASLRHFIGIGPSRSDLTKGACSRFLNPGGLSMTKGITPVLVFGVFMLATVSGRGDGFGGGACCGGPGPCERPVLRAEVTEQKYTVPVKVVPPYTVVTKIAEKEVPCTRTVPVCVTDPCTGCIRTEYKCETVLEKVKTTSIEVIPPTEGCTSRPEERTKRCVTIYIDHLPVCSPAPGAGH